MKSRLSGLMDGEQLARDDELFNALKRGDELRDCWQKYHLIGDALRREPALGSDITSRVMQGLRDEPVVLAPPRSTRHEWQRSALAMAATLAGVAVVGWIALAPFSGPALRPAPNLAQSAGTPPPVVQAAASRQPARPASRDMQEYLVAHQTQLSSLQFRGGTEYIRTVSVSQATPAK